MHPQQNPATVSAAVHKGPHPGLLAVLYTVLFCAGLYPVTALYKQPYWPPPWEQPSVIVPFFQQQGSRVLLCLFLQLGAMLCLGLFTATIASRLHFLGARAAGVFIALFGGFFVVVNSTIGSMAMWTLIHPVIAANPPTLLALYYLGYALGGPGFSIPMGLLMAGVSVTAAFLKVLPRWVIGLGMFLAVAGELSWFHIVFERLFWLVPLVRFPGFIWLIAVGFLLPKRRRAASSQALAA